MGPLSRLWKGLDDVWNKPSEAVEVPVDTFTILIEQITVLLDQASLSISYARHLNILKTLLKDHQEENSATRTPYDHSDRCLNKRLKGILQGSYDKGGGGEWSKEE